MNIIYKSKYKKYTKKIKKLKKLKEQMFGSGEICQQMNEQNKTLLDASEYDGQLSEGFINKAGDVIVCEKNIDKKNGCQQIGVGSQGAIYKGSLMKREEIKVQVGAETKTNLRYIKIKSVAIKKMDFRDRTAANSVCDELDILLTLKGSYVAEYIGYSAQTIEMEPDVVQPLEKSGSLSINSGLHSINSTASSLSGWTKPTQFVSTGPSITVHIFMVYIDGMDLNRYIRNMIDTNRIINHKELVAIADQLCKGLKHIHKNNIAHRDIKPQNIMIAYDGAVKYIDFGIACNIAGNGKCKSNIGGTISYMSPELLDGIAVTDPIKDDMWALGVTLYQLFTQKMFMPDDYNRDILSFLMNTDYTIDESRRKPLIMILRYLLCKPTERTIYTFDDFP